jgi:signal transduction histidine kinase
VAREIQPFEQKSSLFRVFSIIPIAIGSLVLIGWTFGVPPLKSFFPGFITMKANTAICFVFLGSASLLLGYGRVSKWRRVAALGLLGLVVATCLGTLFEYLLGPELGIDQLFFSDVEGIGGNFPPGRLAPITAVCFLLLSAGFVSGKLLRRPLARTAQVLGLVTLVVAFQSFAGYMIGITNLFGSAYYTQMALHTAVAFIMLSGAFLLSLPHRGIFESVFSETASSRMARQMLLAVVLVPMIVRWCAKLGFDHGYYDSDFALLIQVMGSVILMALIVINSSATMLRADRELARLFESERDARLKAEEASIAKTNFLANMSHEIRTPLGAVLGFSELLANSDLESTGDSTSSDGQAQSRRDLSDAIRRNGKQLLHLIDDILDVSKIEAGHLNLLIERFEIGELYREIERTAQLYALEKNVVLSFDSLSRGPATVESDPHRVRQIVCNLVLNAIKFTPAGGLVHVRVEHIAGSKSRLRFTIEDNGIGISPEEAARLFRPFAQVDSSVTRAFGGSGLGLALSRRLARALGGDVQLVRSEKGVGSTFVAEHDGRAEPNPGTEDW